jgi:tRNA 2-thiouridine synthesizing protein A
MTQVRPDVVLDTKGMIWPLPVLKVKKAVALLQKGQVMNIVSEDAASKTDIAIFVQKLGLELLETLESNGVFEFHIRK